MIKRLDPFIKKNCLAYSAAPEQAVPSGRRARVTGDVGDLRRKLQAGAIAEGVV